MASDESNKYCYRVTCIDLYFYGIQIWLPRCVENDVLRKTMNLSFILTHYEDSPSALSVCNCDFHSEKQAGLKIS